MREELAIQAVIGEEMDNYDFQYPGAPLTRLFFFHVTEFVGEPQNLDFEQIVWRGAVSFRPTISSKAILHLSASWKYSESPPVNRAKMEV